MWSPQSIEFSLQQFCLPFLRLSCLLQHHLYGDSLPGCPVHTHTASRLIQRGSQTNCYHPSQVDEEFSLLTGCLGLLGSGQSAGPLNSAACLKWNFSAFDMISQWCSEVIGFSDTPAQQSVVSLCCVEYTVGHIFYLLFLIVMVFFLSFLCLIKKLFQSLLVQDPQWAAPRLLHLPDNYNTIFQYYHRKSCSSCNKTPKDPALCLVCGAFVCLKGHCCKQQGVCECVLVSISLTPAALHRHPILMITLYAFFNL